MKASPLAVFLILAGGVLMYSGVTRKDPRDIILVALGRPPRTIADAFPLPTDGLGGGGGKTPSYTTLPYTPPVSHGITPIPTIWPTT